ncbi:helix-turn-helix transcriptional regulator [Arthrobacter sp. RAF14]|uniref:helix-turn-helix transcriptional regulator n=1 Tax=Arthrobacter sp. RAF14 TaxID=3233051 RepID=UPI003F8FF385
MSARKTERILNLLIALLSSPRGHTRAYLESTVYAYCRAEGMNDAAIERMFERDKAELRDMGVPLEVVEDETFDVDDSAGARYRVNPGEYLLPVLHLTAEERLLLQLAAQLWEQASLRSAGSAALRKLSDGQEPDDGAPSPVLPRVTTGGAALEALHRALAGRHPVRFGYRAAGAAEATTRRLEPYGLGNRSGQWYVVGHDLDRGAQRTFRLSRITTAVEVDARKRYAPPQDFSIAAALDSMEAYPEQRAVVRLPHGGGAQWRARATHVDGDHATLSYQDESAFLDELAAVAPTVQLVEPARLRDAVVSRLQAAVTALSRPAEVTEFRSPPVKRGPKSSSETTVRRLLGMIPFLVRHGGILKSELAAEFGITGRQLDDDLERIMMVGRPEGYHNDLMDIVDDGQRVWINNALDLAQPIRFSPEEAWTLLVGLDALSELGIGGDADAIESLRLRLAGAAGDSLALAEAIKVRMAPSGNLGRHLAQLRAALERGVRVRIEYVVPSRDELTERLIDPRRLRSVDQQWYLDAWCHRAGAARNFRLDRIASLEITEETVDPSLWDGAVDEVPFSVRDQAPRVLVIFSEESRWLAARYNALRTAALDGGDVLAELAVASPSWLAGLVAQTGGTVRVVGPEPVVDQVREWLARSLDSYGAASLRGYSQLENGRLE